MPSRLRSRVRNQRPLAAHGDEAKRTASFTAAFAYSDPERIQSLQRMLDLAATRGLQIIVLTCTPGDYSALGANEIRLTN